ncbi:MAG TPA: AEC family transporter [Ottowia sp.]|uniref:AEC family transporter n=1 Tax=Ottowia sp. TaxID=1898956 RepID=UPI002C6143EA|nr:AEC family transporter [Ottowia sp.]HMN21296.1 AEC family transporter [Ottowia sp.]
MAGILAVTFPFFALVLCGYLAARSRLLPLDAVPGLNMFVLYFALPCMLWRFGSATPAAQLFDPGVALLWILCALLLIWLAAGTARRRGAGWPDAAMGALVAVFPNSGFMGVPLIVALLGDSGAGPVMASLLVDLVLTSSLCIGLSQWHDVGTARLPGESPVVQAVARALRGALVNPLPWSILLGALAGAVGFALWEPLDRTVALLADAASPMALFTIGAVLAREQMQPGLQGVARAALHDVGFITALKLVAHPLLVAGLGALAVWARLLPAPLLVPLVLTAALPAASSVSLLAERFGADNGRVARIILWSTTLAFFSFSGVVALIK